MKKRKMNKKTTLKRIRKVFDKYVETFPAEAEIGVVYYLKPLTSNITSCMVVIGRHPYDDDSHEDELITDRALTATLMAFDPGFESYEVHRDSYVKGIVIFTIHGVKLDEEARSRRVLPLVKLAC